MKRTSLFLVSLVLLASILFVARKQICTKVNAWCGNTPVTSEQGGLLQLATQYYDYSPAALSYAQNHGKTLLYFYAPWCTSCTTFDQDIRAHKIQLPSDVSVLRVDYDHADQLKQQYHVTVQHTFVQIDGRGKMLATWVGGDMSELQQQIQ